LYLQLAEESARTGHLEDRERFWLLAADAALQAGQVEEAERLRRNILSHNSNCFLRPYNSFAEAMKTPDILKYVQDLRKHYPPAQAERRLESLRSQDASKTASAMNVNKAALATLQPNQTLPVGRSPRQPAAPQPTAAVPPPKPPAPAVFQLAPRLPEGPAKTAAWAPDRGRPRRKVRELQPGASIGAVLFVILLAAGFAALTLQFVLPLVHR
jgi:hypothetical protein